MSTILTAALLSVPIMTVTTYLAWYHPRKSIILATEALLYTVPVAAYLTLTLTLVPITAPVWLRILAIASFAGSALIPVPVMTRRTIRRLQAADDAQRHRREEKQPA
ncbi:MAG: hypothetical protein OXG72_12665 [Acidobacteria bacterium]|nr:hypothetical protein [Acidobacteriota bacterium]